MGEDCLDIFLGKIYGILNNFENLERKLQMKITNEEQNIYKEAEVC